KLAPALLAGVPAIVKPATQTSYLTEHVFRRMIESDILPPGAVQLVCGGGGDLFDHLTCQDVVAFTGSASTALELRQHPAGPSPPRPARSTPRSSGPMRGRALPSSSCSCVRSYAR